MHLVTDYLFYNKFLTKWEPSIYEDYDKLNKKIIQKYKVKIPEKVKQKVKFEEGNLSVLEEENIYKFIETIGKIDIRDIVKLKKTNINQKIDQIQLD